MEAFGINGSFKSTCENVMRLLRSNKDSLIAILEEFVTDPLITWRMLAETEEKETVEDSHI
jgi:FKBP12-rapamycin complex-associated protein